jgi:hypothetical protein
MRNLEEDFQKALGKKCKVAILFWQEDKNMIARISNDRFFKRVRIQ